MEILHRDEPRAGELAVRVDAADVLVEQLARELRLVAEHRHEMVVFGEVREDPFEDENVLAVELSLRAREEDLGHTARRELRDQLVGAKISGVARH